jgi:hypothetical protein
MFRLVFGSVSCVFDTSDTLMIAIYIQWNLYKAEICSMWTNSIVPARRMCYLFCIMRKFVQCGKYFRSHAVLPYTSFTVYIYIYISSCNVYKLCVSSFVLICLYLMTAWYGVQDFIWLATFPLRPGLLWILWNKTKI